MNPRARPARRREPESPRDQGRPGGTQSTAAGGAAGAVGRRSRPRAAALALAVPLALVGIGLGVGATDPAGEPARSAAGPGAATTGATPSAAAAGTASASAPAAARTRPAARAPAPGRPVAAPRRVARPAPIRVPAQGSGRFVRARVAADPAGKRGRLVRYGVRVEKGLDLDAAAQARIIQAVLDDRRSWRGSGRWRFELVRSTGQADLHVFIATPATTDRLCAPLRTLGKVSCQTGNRVVLNARRWTFGARSYGTDVVNYRRYLVNHEFGHFLGYGHVGCPGKGKRAPVMMQQTKGLKGCRANPWRAPGRR